MKAKHFLSLALLALSGMTGSSAWAHDGEHSYTNGICTIEGCTDKYQPAEKDADGFFKLYNAGNIEWMSAKVAAGASDGTVAFASSKYKLMNDIDFENKENLHSPIGPNDSHKFVGHFNGQGFRIKNMRIVKVDNDNIGFFGVLRSGGTIVENLIIDKSCYISGKNRVGGITGAAHVYDENPCTIRCCVNEGEIHSTNTGAGIYGAGWENSYPNMHFINCINVGPIYATTAAVSIAGYVNSNNKKNNQMTSCLNIGPLDKKLEGNNMYRGAYRGGANNVDYATTNSKDQGYVAASTWKTSDPVKSGELCYYMNKISKANVYYQEIGVDEYPTPINNGKIVYEVSDHNCDGSVKVGADVFYSNEEGGTIDPHTYTAESPYTCTVCKAINEEYVEKDDNGFYHLSTVTEVEWFAEMVNLGKPNMNGKLDADIDYDGKNHILIGNTETYKFNSTFDGQGHKISNLVVNTPDKDYVGFFGWLRGAGTTTIQNLIIDKTCSFTGKNKVGALAGTIQVDGGTITVENVVNEANVEAVGGTDAGGIFGGENGGNSKYIIRNVVNKGNVTSTGSAGALCCYLRPNGESVLENFVNMGTITNINEGKFNVGRHNINNSTNVIDLSDTKGKTQGIDTDLTLADAATGKLAYYLNANDKQDEDAFFQTIGSDDYPVPFSKNHSKVYANGRMTCNGNLYDITFSNTDNGEVIKDDHIYTIESPYTCTTCNELNETWKTEQADGYYHFSTVDEIEWWSKMVNEKWHGCMNVKLDADIDFGGVENAHTPIGCSGHKWAAKFDGQGHHIKGMVITPNKTQYHPYDGLGFFGSVRGGVKDDKWDVQTNGAEIKNLFIDADCSIKHTSNFAAGVVGHINSTFSGAIITIENCGNEANIHTTGKNAAGILGCVEGTNVGLVLHNLWNKGDITGEGGESAAICAWSGQRNVDGEVDIEGCWNIGEVTGVDGNGYNLVRRNTNIVPRNMVDLCTTNEGNQGKVAELNTADPISSGELCYLLNGDQTKIVYTQNIGEDEMPVYGTTSAEVKAASVGNAGYATYVADEDVKFNAENLEAYVVSSTDKGYVELADVTEVPAGEAVVLMAAKGTYYFNTTSEAATPEANELIAATEDVTADGTQYVLAKVDDEIGFYKATTGTIKAGKAYLSIAAGAKAFYGFEANDETAISNVEANTNANEAIYNLAGQRVQKMQKGINIVGGKKVMK